MSMTSYWAKRWAGERRAISTATPAKTVTTATTAGATATDGPGTTMLLCEAHDDVRLVDDLPTARPRRSWTQRVTHPMALIGIATTVLTAAGVSGPIIAALFAIVLAAWPGSLIADRAAPRLAAERWIVVVSVNLTFWMVIAHLLLSAELWHPEIGIAAVTGCLTMLHLVSERPAPGLLGGLRRCVTALGPVGVVAIAGGLTCWLIAAVSTPIDDIGPWGLVSNLPPIWFIGFAVLLVFTATRATTPNVDPRGPMIGLISLTFVVYGTTAIATNTLRYPWSYKHVGVIRLLDTTGRLHPHVDIYNNFSGFFGLGALVRGGTGADPLDYGAWAQVVASGLIMCAVWVLVRSATRRADAAHLAALLYLLTDWVGQNYFAPQALGSFLSIAVLALTISWFASPDTRRIPLVGRWVAAQTHPDAEPESTIGDELTEDELAASLRSRDRIRLGIVAFAFLGLLMTHPLTPFSTVLPLVAAFILGWMRDRRLLLAVGLAVAAWMLRSLPYFVEQAFDLGFGGSVSDNAAGRGSEVSATGTVALVGVITKLFSVAVWGIGALGALVAFVRRRRPGWLVLVGFSPLVLPFLNSYGGEIIYRAYLYSLPGIVGLAALFLLGDAATHPRRFLPGPRTAATLTSLALAAGFLVVHFSREQINTVEPSEVALEEYVGTLPDKEYITAQFSGGYPGSLTERYPMVQVDDTYTPQVDEMLDPTEPLTPQLDAAADDIVALTDGVAYLVVTPGMIDTMDAAGTFSFEDVDAVLELLATSDRFVPITRFGDSWLLQVLP